MDGKTIIIIIYLIVLLIVVDAELVITYHSVSLGLWIYALLLLSLIAASTLSIRNKTILERYLSDRYMLKPIILAKFFPQKVNLFRIKDPSLRKEDDLSNLLKCLTLAPLIRILSMSMPVAPLEQIHWFVIINAPLLVVVILFIKSQNLSLSHIGFKLGNPVLLLLIALSGVMLGVMDYNLLKPSPLIASPTLSNLLVPSVILMVFTGFSEEVIFRGLIQRNSEKMMGNLHALLLTSLLFAAMHIGWQSFPDLIFVFGVGIFYGYVFQKTRNLTGITLSHGITNITMFLVAPFVL